MGARAILGYAPPMTRLWLFAPAALALAATAGCKAGPTGGTRARNHRAADRPAAARATAPAPQVIAHAAKPKPTQGDSWNASRIHWVDYKQGVARAKVEHKPVCLVFFATWCPHCKNYSHVFEDPRVVAEAKKFVMVRVDTDQHPELSQRYSLDGSYIPRTYFLTPGGQVAESVRAPRNRFQYFYNERDPASLLGGMHQAEKLVD